jgi:hypothetical protein
MMEDFFLPAIRMARIERKSSDPDFAHATPATLHHLADGDEDLYIHAMREAGFILIDGQLENPCGVCGYNHCEQKEDSSG